MTRTEGRRVYATRVDEQGKRWYPWPEPGDYWLDENTHTWHCRTPGSPPGDWGDLSNHEVTEHEDGTISVSPSILVEGHDYTWHGYLERGVWRSLTGG